MSYDTRLLPLWGNPCAYCSDVRSIVVRSIRLCFSLGNITLFFPVLLVCGKEVGSLCFLFFF